MASALQWRTQWGAQGPPALPNAGSHTQNPEKGTISLGLEAPKSARPCSERLACHRLSDTQVWAPTVASTTPGTLSDAAGAHPPMEARPPEDSPDQQHGWLCGQGRHGATWTRGFPAPSEELHSARIPETGHFSFSLSEFFSELCRKGSEPYTWEEERPLLVALSQRRPWGPQVEAAVDPAPSSSREHSSDSWGARSSSPTGARTAPRTECGSTALAWVPGVSTGGSPALLVSWEQRGRLAEHWEP